MNVFIRIVVGIGVIFFGLMVYPYYVDYMLTPLIDVAQDLGTLSAWEEAALGFAPFFAFCIIIFFGIMYMVGRIGLFQSQPDKLIDDANDSDED